MVNGVENNLVLNNNPKVGILTPPNALHKPKLYSDKEAEMQFQQLSHDIYQKQSEHKFENKRKTPFSVILTLCAAAAGAAYIVFKKAMKW